MFYRFTYIFMHMSKEYVDTYMRMEIFISVFL